MRLTKGQQNKIIMVVESENSRGGTEFNKKHGTNIKHDTVAKLSNKHQKTINVAD